MHVPWTALAYEPVQITLNALEFVVGPGPMPPPPTAAAAATAAAADARTRNAAGSSDALAASASASEEGTLQGLLARIRNSIAFSVNNLIVKYQDDAAVASLLCSSISWRSADASWAPAFAVRRESLFRGCRGTYD